MGKFSEKYKSENADFKFELNQLIQKVRSEKDEETQDLFSTINSLREKLDQSLFDKNTAVQEAILNKNNEMNQLKSAVKELRDQLEQVNLKTSNMRKVEQCRKL